MSSFLFAVITVWFPVSRRALLAGLRCFADFGDGFSFIRAAYRVLHVTLVWMYFQRDRVSAKLLGFGISWLCCAAVAIPFAPGCAKTRGANVAVWLVLEPWH